MGNSIETTQTIIRSTKLNVDVAYHISRGEYQRTCQKLNDHIEDNVKHVKSEKFYLFFKTKITFRCVNLYLSL